MVRLTFFMFIRVSWFYVVSCGFNNLTYSGFYFCGFSDLHLKFVMPSSCSAYNCTNYHYKGTDKIFHRFPLSNTELCKKWIVASKHDDFVPSNASFICSDHFTKEDYLFSNSKKLKPNSVPSKFNFPVH